MVNLYPINMKHLVFSTLLFFCSLGLSAQAIQPILFDDPTFDIHSSQLSEAQRSFFTPYLQAMEQMHNGASAERFFVIEHASSEEGVSPLLGEINFNQGTPYNDKCPYLNGGRAVTGCVATAMAMIMRYYQYPAHGTGTFTYTGGSDGAKTVNLEDLPFDWNNILPSYHRNNYNQAQADAVATLMLACGASLNMDYDKDGSGANTSVVNKLLKNNFGYHKDAAFISTENSDNPEETIFYWGEDAVRPNLDEGHPLIFAGYPSLGQSGHCFVIDGYKVENDIYYYHVNWGWGGAGNCWCLLTKLEDDAGRNYAGHNLQMVYNIYPANWQAIDEIEVSEQPSTRKILLNGNMIIERNQTQFTLQGQRIQ